MASAMRDPSNIAFIIAGAMAASLVAAKVFWRSDLDAFPTVGCNSWLGSWWAGFKFSENALDVIRDGYAKHKGRPFKIAYYYRWLVITSNREHMEELQRSSKDEFSFHEVIRERLSGDCTIGKENLTNPYHVPIVRSQFSRNIGSFCPEIRDEIVTTFDEVLNLTPDEWKSMPALNTIQKVIFRTSNRLYVGLPLCRDPGWMTFSIQNTADIINGSQFLQRFPLFLQQFASLFIPNATQAAEDGMKFIAPVITDRQRHLNEFGNNWVEKPNDFLSWLMDAAEGEERTAKRLTNRVMFLNFASIHNISESFTHALIYLAANPQHVQPLREEVEVAVGEEGWSKVALTKMHKIDSLLRETQRLKGTGSESLGRKTMKDYTFSDGTFIPKGTLIATPSGCIHLDDEFYENANVFDPFRFVKMRDGEDESSKRQYVSTSLEYLPFGHGKHACPGRFFSAAVMKMMLAHIVLSYDVKLEDGASVPDEIHVGTTVRVDPSAKVMFKRRC